MLLHHLLRDGAARFPEKVALGWVKRDRSLGYAEAAAATDRVAAGLAALGVERGDRVGVFAHSGLDYLLAMFGSWRAGAVAALVDLRHADDLDAYFGDCRPRVVIYTHDYFEAVDRHREALGSVETYVCFDGAQPGALDWAELLGHGGAPPSDVASESDIAHLSYTVGPGGRPAGSCLSHGAILRAGRSVAGRAGLGPDDVSLGPTALSGPYQPVANLAPALSASATCWVMNDWDAEGGLDMVGQLGATVLAADPAVLAAALRQAESRDGGPPASLRLILSGDGPASGESERAWSDGFGVAVAGVPQPESSAWSQPET